MLGNDTRGMTVGGELGFVHTVSDKVDTILSISNFVNFPKAYVDIFSTGRYNLNVGLYYKY